MHRVRPPILVVESGCDGLSCACVDEGWVPFSAKSYGAAMAIIGKHCWEGAVVQVPLGGESCEALLGWLTQSSVPYIVFTHEVMGYAAFIEGKPVFAPMSAPYVTQLLRSIMVTKGWHAIARIRRSGD